MFCTVRDYCQMYQYKPQEVMVALYDIMSNWCKLCHKVILSTANNCKARTISTNWCKWLGSKMHPFQNLGLQVVQSGNSSTGEDKQDLHIPRQYVPSDMQQDGLQWVIWCYNPATEVSTENVVNPLGCYSANILNQVCDASSWFDSVVLTHISCDKMESYKGECHRSTTKKHFEKPTC